MFLNVIKCISTSLKKLFYLALHLFSSSFCVNIKKKEIVNKNTFKNKVKFPQCGLQFQVVSQADKLSVF